MDFSSSPAGSRSAHGRLRYHTAMSALGQWRTCAVHSVCPLWVKSRNMQCTNSCPLYPQKRPRKQTSANGHVCFTPKSGHVRCTSRCLLWANSGHPGNLNLPCYSMTSSVRPSNLGGTSMPSDLAVLALTHPRYPVARTPRRERGMETINRSSLLRQRNPITVIVLQSLAKQPKFCPLVSPGVKLRLSFRPATIPVVAVDSTRFAHCASEVATAHHQMVDPPSEYETLQRM